VIAVILVEVFVMFLMWGIISRHRKTRAWLWPLLKRAYPPSVYVVRPTASTTPEMSLPGTTQAMQDAITYARVKWLSQQTLR